MLNTENFVKEVKGSFCNKNVYFNDLLNLVNKLESSHGQYLLKQYKNELYLYKELILELSHIEVKALFMKMSIEKNLKYLFYLGLERISKNAYSLKVHKFLTNLIVSYLESDISFDERVEMSFCLYDIHNTGEIDSSALFSMLFLFDLQNGLKFDEKTINSISSLIMRKLNTKQIINKEDFFYLINMLSEEKQQQDNIEIFPEVNFWTLLRVLLVLQIKNIIWLIIYIILNIYFGVQFFLWNYKEGFLALPFAKMFAGLIMINITLVFIFVCQYTISSLKSIYFLNKILPLDDVSFNHKLIGWVIIGASLGHVLAHCLGTFPFIAALTDVDILNNILNVNYKRVPTYSELMISVASITGWLLCLFLSLMVIAFILFKNKKYEIFWFTHKLYFIVVILLGLHIITRSSMIQMFWKFFVFPAIIFSFELIMRLIRFFLNKANIVSFVTLESGVVELVVEKPKYFNYKVGEYASINIPEISPYQYHPFTIASSPSIDLVTFYIAPVGWFTRCCYKIGKRCVNKRRKQTNDVLLEPKNFSLVNPFKNKNHLPYVTISRIQTDNKNTEPNQVISNKSVKSSKNYENHYWNDEIVSNNEKNFSVSKKLSRNSFGRSSIDSLVDITKLMKKPYIRLDGPFGTPSISFTNYNHLMLIASGVGATPFASMLLDILYNFRLKGLQQFKSISFYWVQRNYKNASWLIDLLREVMDYDENKLLDINLYCTNKKQKIDPRSNFLWKGLQILKKEQSNLVSDYCMNIEWNRPSWLKLFVKKKFQLVEYKERIGVFVCGNSGLCEEVYLTCLKASDCNLIFDFHKENF